MGSQDPRVDTYIERAAGFAQPLLHLLRARFHAASPDLDEAIKWGRPAFLYRGKLLGGMAAFKHHVALNFWHGAQVVGAARDEAMGQFGRLTGLDELPDATTFNAMVQRAIALIDAGVTRPSGGRRREPLPMPAEFAAALERPAVASAQFDAFSPRQRREYIEWISDAKREETRTRRIAQAVGQLAAGKPHNWKYLVR